MQPNPFFVASVEDTHAARTASPVVPASPMVNVRLNGPATAGRSEPEVLPPIDNAGDLVADATITLPPEIIVGVLHQGLKCVLGSASKARKTWILLDLALSVATGSRFWNWDTAKGKVLYVNFEIPKPFLRQRIARLVQAKQLQDFANLDIWTLRGHSAPFDDLVPRMLADIRNAAYTVIIIDPIYKGLAGKDENSAGDVADLCNHLERLAVQSGAAVIYAHHYSKGNQAQKDVMDRMSGSGAFARDADTIITLTKHENDDCYTVDLVLRNLPEMAAFVVEWKYPLMVLRPELDASRLKGKGGRPAKEHATELLGLLRDKELGTTEWLRLAGKELGISKTVFYEQLATLKMSGHIEKNAATDKWRDPQHPPPAPPPAPVPPAPDQGKKS